MLMLLLMEVVMVMIMMMMMMCHVAGIEQVGSVRHVEMLFRTNLIAIVGGGSNPKYADNTGIYLQNVTVAVY